MSHPIHKHMSGQSYDAKKAYDKDLTASARLHYLENSEHDKGVSRKSSSPLNAKPSKAVEAEISEEGVGHNLADIDIKKNR
jgi:hypothetical protein